MSNDYSEGFFSIFTLVLVHLALSLRFLCVVVESIVGERVRIASPSGTVMMDGKLSLFIKYRHTQHTPLY